MNSAATSESQMHAHFVEFITQVKQFSEATTFNAAGTIVDDFRQTKELVATQDRTIESLKSKLKASEHRWESEHPKRISEVFDVHRSETQKIREEKNDLQKNLDQARAESEQLQSRVKSLGKELDKLHGLSKQLEVTEKERAKTETELKNVKQTCRDKDSQIDQHMAKIQELSRAGRDLSEKNTKLQADLDSQSAVVKKVFKFAPQLHPDDIPDLSKALKSLWESCFDAALRCFDVNIARPILENQQAWKVLRETEIISIDLPLPPSNSLPAKRIRTVVLMAVLADALAQHIFTPTYLVQNDEELREICFHLAKDDIERERFLRRILNEIFTEKQKDVKKRRIETALEQVLSSVQALLEDNVANALRTSLTELITQAAELWTRVQQSRSHFESDTISNDSDQERWRAFTWAQANANSPFQERDIPPENLQTFDACLVLFPRIFQVGNPVDQPVFPGILLSWTETRAAKEEWDRIRQSSPMLGRTSVSRSLRGRRATLNEQNGTRRSFLG